LRRHKQPGVGVIRKYLTQLSYKPEAKRCLAGHYYLLNNYNPGYNRTARTATLGPNDFTIPPQHQKSIANVLDHAGVSWTYYGEQWTAAVNQHSTRCRLLHHLQSVPLPVLRDDQRHQARQQPEGHHGPLHRSAERRAAGRLVRQAGRLQ
jgi:hypothetical protein